MRASLRPLLRVALREPQRWRLLRICVRLLHHERAVLDELLSAMSKEMEGEETALVCLFVLFCRSGHVGEVAAFAKRSTGTASIAAATALADVGHKVVPQARLITTPLTKVLSKIPPAGDPEIARPLDAYETTIANLIAGVAPLIDVRLLIELLEYSDQGVSDLAQQALVKLGASVIDELSAMLPSLPVASKARAVRILTELGDRRVVDLVCDECSASPWSVTETGIAALAAFRGERALRTLLDVAVHGRNRALALAALTGFGQPGIDAILGTVRSEPGFAQDAARDVADTTGAQALPVLLEALDDPRRTMRASAEEGLEVLGPLATPALLQKLSDTSTTADVRIRAISLLAKARADEALPVLVEVAKTGVGLERLTAVEALGWFPYDQAAAAITRAGAASTDARLRRSAERAVRQAASIRSADEAIERGAQVFYQQSAVASGGEPAHPIDEWVDSLMSLHSPAWRPAPPPEPVREVGSEVHFSVTAPQRVAPKQTFILELWAHAERASSVLNRSLRLDPAHLRRILQVVGPAYLSTGIRLEVEISIPAFGVQDENSLSWGGAASNCTFAVTVAEGVPNGAHAGVITIRLETVRVAKVSFLIDVGEQPIEDAQDVTSYEQRALRWFASYASDDRNEVLARIQGMQKVIPELDVFFDVASLRSGEDWAQRIVEEIGSRDGLYLFWSPAAMRSKHVDREWRTAFDLKGIEGIDPVPLAAPSIAPPPPELASLHFNEWTLAFRK